MSETSIVEIPAEPDEHAPDGSAVRRLARLPSASMAHFEFTGGKASAAVAHRTIDELWYVLSGSGRMWLAGNGEFDLKPGVSVAVAQGKGFQVMASETLQVVAVAVPPWPGDAEAYSVTGPWSP